MQVWTGEQLGAFLAATADDPLAMLYRLVAHTGLRRGEAVALRWTEVDLAVGSSPSAVSTSTSATGSSKANPRPGADTAGSPLSLIHI